MEPPGCQHPVTTSTDKDKADRMANTTQTNRTTAELQLLLILLPSKTMQLAIHTIATMDITPMDNSLVSNCNNLQARISHSAEAILFMILQLDHHLEKAIMLSDRSYLDGRHEVTMMNSLSFLRRIALVDVVMRMMILHMEMYDGEDGVDVIWALAHSTKGRKIRLRLGFSLSFP